VREIERPTFGWPYCLFFLGVVVISLWQYWSIVVRGATNTPFADDYRAILCFANHWLEQPLASRLTSLFTLHNEHCIAVLRTIIVLMVTLCGEVTFNMLLYIGHSMLMLTVILLAADEVRQDSGRGRALRVTAFLSTAAGLITMFKWLDVGGSITFISIAALLGINWSSTGRIPGSWVFSMFLVTGCLGMVAALLRRRHGAR